MTDVDSDNKRERRKESVDAKTDPIPFMDFLLCCYVYIGNSGSYANNKRSQERNRDSKHRRC
jgi:hypothetical protein